LLLKTLESAGGLEELNSAHGAVSAYHGNNYLALVERFYPLAPPGAVHPGRRDRSGAHDGSVLNAVGQPGPSWGLDRGEDHRQGGRQQVTVAVNVERDRRRPGMLSRRHLEVCVSSYLAAAELRSGASRWWGRTPTPTCIPS
jgi:hypothetical protein